MMDGFFQEAGGFRWDDFLLFFFFSFLLIFFNVGRCGNGYEELWFLALLASE